MYIIWTDYGVEGWQPVEAADWDDAVRRYVSALSDGNSRVLITLRAQVEMFDRTERGQPPRAALLPNVPVGWGKAGAPPADAENDV